MQPSEQRDPAFWRGVLNDAAVAPTLFGRPVEAVIEVVQNPAVVPLATENGGLIFIGRCGFGRVFELHTAYRPAGWGREVHSAAKAAFARIFESAELVFTHEQLGQWRTRPPRSFGFEALGSPFENEFGRFQLWMLTRARWAASPAQARMQEAH
jgi:hypothetical protein